MTNIQTHGKLPAIIVDVDGTIAIRGARSPYDMTRVSQDLPNQPVIDFLLQLTNLDFQLLFVTGRDESARVGTEDFISKYLAIQNPILFMRDVGDSQSDASLKKQIYIEKIEQNYSIRYVFDDRNQVVRMWRDDLNLTVFQVAEGDF